jgi:hypothetical protein
MRYVLLLLLSATAAFSQNPTPSDCSVAFTLSGAGSRSGVPSNCFPNQQGVWEWRVTYYVNGFSGVSVALQDAPDSNGTPGTWVNFAGTITSGYSNPSTTTPEGSISATGYYPWVSVTLGSATGAGTVRGVLYGCKEPGCSIAGPGGGGGGGGSGCAGTIMTPCQTGVDNAGTTEPTAGDSAGDTYVVGPTAVGSALSKNPVSIGASDGTDVRAVLSDVNGRILNGAYPTTAAPSGSTSGLVQVIAASSGKTTTISHWDVLFASGATFQLEYGTGTNCGTGTTAITAQYPSTFLGVAIDVPFVVPASQAVCYNIGSSIVWGGFLVYSQP